MSTLIDKLSIELSKVAKWLAVNQLTLNVCKTNYVLFHSCRLHVPPNVSMIKIDDDIFERVFKSKFLGVTLDQRNQYIYIYIGIYYLTYYIPIRKYFE